MEHQNVSSGNCNTLTAGYDGGTAIKWLRNIAIWGVLLKDHPLWEEALFPRRCKALSAMLQQALSNKPDVPAYVAAARRYVDIMLLHFPKQQFRIYEHMLLDHVPSLLRQGSLLTGSTFFLEALNKDWKRHLLDRTNNGGGKRPGSTSEESKRTPADAAERAAIKAATMDFIAIGDIWALTHPELARLKQRWAPRQGRSAMAAVHDGETTLV